MSGNWVKQFKFSQEQYHEDEILNQNLIVNKNVVIRDTYWTSVTNSTPRTNHTEYYFIGQNEEFWKKNATRLINGSLASCISQDSSFYLVRRADDNSVELSKIAFGDNNLVTVKAVVKSKHINTDNDLTLIHDAKHNELIVATYSPTLKESKFYFYDGDTLEMVKAPR